MNRTVQSFLTSVALATAVLTQTQAWAATDPAPIEVRGVFMNRHASFEFSERLVGALNAASILTSGMGSSRVTEDFDTGQITVEAPLVSGTVHYDDAAQAYVTQSARTRTSFLLNSQPSLSSGKKSSVTLPGWLTMSNLEIDFHAKAIYVDLAGDNGLGTRIRQHLWNFETVRSSAAYSSSLGGVMLTDEVQGLTITDAGFNLFAQGLGLSTSLGIPSMRSISDYGVIRTQMLAPVPEPSTFALLGLGLLGLIGAARARRLHSAA